MLVLECWTGSPRAERAGAGSTKRGRSVPIPNIPVSRQLSGFLFLKVALRKYKDERNLQKGSLQHCYNRETRKTSQMEAHKHCRPI